jgi:hypothetical protein
LKEEKACVLTMSSVEGESWLGTKINRDKSLVTTEIHKAFIYVTAPEKNKCRLKMIINADPHIHYIPQKLINFGLKNVIGVFLKMI